MAALDYNYIAGLVAGTLKGDSDSFAELYAATHQKQYQFAYSYLKDEYLAQDALQETYFIALKELSKLKDPMLLVAWLNQINFRVCFQLYKKQKRYDTELEGYDGSIGKNLNSEYSGRNSLLVAKKGNPGEIVVEIDSRRYIMDQLMKLPFKEAQVITLRFYQNLSFDEIAQIMEISKSSVRRCLSRGKEHLANMLKRQGGEFYP